VKWLSKPTVETFLCRLAKREDVERVWHHTVPVLVLMISVLQVAGQKINLSTVSGRCQLHQFDETLLNTRTRHKAAWED